MLCSQEGAKLNLAFCFVTFVDCVGRRCKGNVKFRKGRENGRAVPHLGDNSKRCSGLELNTRRVVGTVLLHRAQDCHFQGCCLLLENPAASGQDRAVGLLQLELCLTWDMQELFVLCSESSGSRIYLLLLGSQ